MLRKILKITVKLKVLLLAACMLTVLVFNLLPAAVLGSKVQTAEIALNAGILSSEIIWDGSIADTFAGGEGSLEKPYQISSGAQLAFLAREVNNDVEDEANGGRDYSKYYVLINDIYLNDTEGWKNWMDENPEDTALNKWTPIGKDGADFKANFDGGGFKVCGIYISAGSDNKGLFGSVDGGSIRNLGVEQSYIKGGNTVGGIAGWLKNSSITNCYNSGMISGVYSGVSGGDNIGGIAGHANTGSVIANCYNIGDVSGVYSVGGIAGYLNSKDKKSFIRNCYNAGSVICGNSAKQAGYLAGFVRYGCEVSYSYYLKDINGGLFGMSGNSTGAILSVLVFCRTAVLASPAILDGGQFLDLTSALNAYADYENINNPSNYAIWHGKPFPNFDERTPTPEHIPDALTAVYGSTLSAADLAVFNDENGQWKWKVPSADVGTAGINSFEAVYTPNNTADYNSINLQLPITVNPKPLTGELKPVSGKFIYNGSPHTPEAEVAGLTLNKDYTVSYSNNTKPGTATLTITGIGNYCGELSVNFTIAKVNAWEWYYTVAIVFVVIILCGATGVCIMFDRKRKKAAFESIEAKTGMTAGNLYSFEEAEALRDLLKNKLSGEFTVKNIRLPDELTLREREVAALILRGKKSKEIAVKLFISNATVKKHIQSILRKSDCKDQLNFVIKYGGRQ